MQIPGSNLAPGHGAPALSESPDPTAPRNGQPPYGAMIPGMNGEPPYGAMIPGMNGQPPYGAMIPSMNGQPPYGAMIPGMNGQPPYGAMIPGMNGQPPFGATTPGMPAPGWPAQSGPAQPAPAAAVPPALPRSRPDGIQLRAVAPPDAPDPDLPAPGVHARRETLEFDAVYRPMQSPTLATYPPPPARTTAPGAAPVAPVACPSYVPPAPAPQAGAPGQRPGQGPAQAQPAQHPLAPRMVAAARYLEQMMPSVQILLALVQDIATGETGDAMGELRRALSSAVATHQAALGFIRRFLCGESTPAVARGIGVAVRELRQQFASLDQLLESTARQLPATARMSLLSMLNQVTAASAALDQAASTVEGGLGSRMMDRRSP